MYKPLEDLEKVTKELGLKCFKEFNIDGHTCKFRIHYYKGLQAFVDNKWTYCEYNGSLLDIVKEIKEG